MISLGRVANNLITIAVIFGLFYMIYLKLIVSKPETADKIRNFFNKGDK
jgi:hypothetical protein